MLGFLKTNIKLIVILITIGVVVWKCQNTDNPQQGEIVKVDGKKYELLKKTIDTFYVDRWHTKVVKGKDIYHETIIEKTKEVKVPVYTKGDTVRIVEAYNKKVLVKDKLVLDNNLGEIELTDTLYQNKILGRKWNALIKEKTIKETQIVKELPRNQVYIGVQTMVGNSSAMAGPQLTLKTKKDNLYGTSLLIDGNGNKYLGVSVGWKIRIKK